MAVAVHVESGVAMAYDDGVAAWSFDLASWGTCGQGRTEAAALADLRRRTGVAELEVVERISGDEQAFAADRLPATLAQREATLRTLADARSQLTELVSMCPPELFDVEPPGRVLPRFASWYTLR